MLALVLGLALAVTAQNLSVEHLKVQNLRSPTIDLDANIVFTWVPVAADRNQSSIAYRVVVRDVSGQGTGTKIP